MMRLAQHLGQRVRRPPGVPRRWRPRWRQLAALAATLLAGVLTWDAANLDLAGPAPTYLLLDRHGRFIAELGSEPDPEAPAEEAETAAQASSASATPPEWREFGYWPLDELPPRVVAAALALEDRRFYSHPGVDPLAVGRAILQNLVAGDRVSGASTIAMQTARLLDPGDRTYLRKLREAWRALVLTVRFGRQEVLATYLRLVPYGTRVRGIAYAARRYLDKPVADLSWAEIAFLSAIPQAPSLMNPLREDGRRRAIDRGIRILARLHDGGVLNAAEHEMALEQIRVIQLPNPPVRPPDTLHAIFKLREVLATTPPSGPEPYRVRTTLDLDLQHEIGGLAAQAVYEWANRGVGNAAVVLLDRTSGEVLTWLGSTDYFSAPQSGALDYASTPRSPGSTLKPFIYALALDRGRITPATILDDLPSRANGIVNADRGYLGPLLPRQALANSRNLPAAHLLAEVGIDEGYGFLYDLGLHQRERDARSYGLGMVVGTLPVTLEKLVQAYTPLANDGIWRPLRWYTGQDGKERRLLAASTARIITLHLSDVGARLPSFPRMGSTEYPFPVALKTGSSQGLRDAWVVAYSSRYLLGVWVGHPDARPMREMTGASSAAVLAHRILSRLHADQRQGFSDLGFPPPEDYRPVTLCGLTGKLATPACDRRFEEWFAPDDEPVETDDAFVRLAIDRRDGSLAHARTPARQVEWRTFVNLPPRYAEWAAQAGLPRPPASVSVDPQPVGGSPAPQRLLATATSRFRIAAPSDGLKLLRDPTIPPAHNTIALQVEVSPPVPEVLWLIDGQPFQLAPYPYTVRWPLQAGEHLIQARSPLSGEISPAVRIRVD